MNKNDLDITFAKNNCAIVRHIPTGFTERCCDARSQGNNLLLATNRIKARLVVLQFGKTK